MLKFKLGCYTAGGLVAVGLGRDGPQHGEALEQSEPEEGKGEWEEGEGADARAPCGREREGGSAGVDWSSRRAGPRRSGGKERE